VLSVRCINCIWQIGLYKDGLYTPFRLNEFMLLQFHTRAKMGFNRISIQVSKCNCYSQPANKGDKGIKGMGCQFMNFPNEDGRNKGDLFFYFISRSVAKVSDPLEQQSDYLVLKTNSNHFTQILVAIPGRLGAF